MLRQSKMLTLVAVLSLGLGIGSTSTIYALVDQLLIHDVTVREPERLVSLGGSWSSYPNYRDIRDSGVFAELAANTQCYPEPRWREGDQTHAISAECVSANFFEVMGVPAARGRVFTDDEAAAEKNPRVVVISHQILAAASRRRSECDWTCLHAQQYCLHDHRRTPGQLSQGASPRSHRALQHRALSAFVRAGQRHDELYRTPGSWLLRAQCRHRLDASRTARRQPACERADPDEQRRHREKDNWVEWTGLEEESLQPARQQQG